MSSAIIWPDKPSAHGVALRTFPGPAVWRPEPAADGRRPLRKCSYCGSLHPEDLLSALQNGAKLEASDWKYGWPHKFYIKGIPNPAEGLLTMVEGGSTTANSPRLTHIAASLRPGEKLEVEDGPGDSVSYTVYAPQGSTTHGKWYSEHFIELRPEAFHALAPYFDSVGVRFTLDDQGRVKWSLRKISDWELG